MKAAILFLAVVLPVAAEDVATAHYDVHAEGMDAKEAGAILEALYGNLEAYFGKVPKLRMRVEIFADNEGFQAALKSDKQAKLESGGYYSPDTKKAYLFVQPSAFYTRQLLIHEATHQFHFLAATDNRNPGSFWYAEGLAEYFGLHDWDGTTLRTGVIPAATLEDYPAQALKQFDALKQDLAGVATGRVGCERPVGWALVHFLVNQQPRGWRTLAALLDAGKKQDTAWEKAFGRTDAAFTKQFRDWLEAHQQPLRIVFVSWQERGEAVQGEGQAPAIALYKSAPAALSVEIEGVKGDLNAGIVFNFVANEDYCVFRIAAGKIYASHFLNRVWSELASAELDPAVALHVLSARTDGKELVLLADAKEVHRVAAGGATGLFVEACTARFRVKK